jgi:hypothetical protein
VSVVGIGVRADLDDMMPVVCSGSEAPEEILCKPTGHIPAGVERDRRWQWDRMAQAAGPVRYAHGVLVLVEIREDEEEQIETGYKTE